MNRVLRIRACVTVAAIAAWTGVANACPFCSTAKTGSGYLVATLVLLVAPLAAIGWFVLWVRRCARSTTAPAAESGAPSAQSSES
jgi:beta-lactamase class D